MRSAGSVLLIERTTGRRSKGCLNLKQSARPAATISRCSLRRLAGKEARVPSEEPLVLLDRERYGLPGRSAGGTVRSVIRASWARCQRWGLPIEDLDVPSTSDYDVDSRLTRSAGPVLAALQSTTDRRNDLLLALAVQTAMNIEAQLAGGSEARSVYELDGYLQAIAQRPRIPVPSTARFRLSRFEVIERDAIVAALQRSGGAVTQAAEDLGFSRATMYRKIKRYGIRAERTRSI